MVVTVKSCVIILRIRMLTSFCSLLLFTMFTVSFYGTSTPLSGYSTSAQQ